MPTRREDWNDCSYILRLDYGGRRLVLPGDAEELAWDALAGESAVVLVIETAAIPGEVGAIE